MAKREYRGQRSAEKFVEFVSEQTTDPINEFTSLEELTDMDDKKRYLIGYFEEKDTPDYENFRRVATNLKDECVFYAGFGEVSEYLLPQKSKT